jgi:hypothetical protein
MALNQIAGIIVCKWKLGQLTSGGRDGGVTWRGAGRDKEMTKRERKNRNRRKKEIREKDIEEERKKGMVARTKETNQQNINSA